MGDIIVDAKIRVWFLITMPVNLALPTLAEVNGGLVLNPKITKDGLIGFEPDTATVETTAIDSEFGTKRVGRTNFDGTMLRLKKQDGVDTIYNTMVKYQLGCLIVRRDLHKTIAAAAGQKVECYPIECGETRRLAPEENTLSRYEIPTPIIDDVVLRATIAA